MTTDTQTKLKECYDKNGIPIMPGDVLKMFHYTAAVRREKRYMYKHVMCYGGPDEKFLKISHLQQNYDRYFLLLRDGKYHEDIEIVQGYAGVEPGEDYRDRLRKGATQ